ncbi:MAG: DUF192 domain-containing protein [Melioribacteraceae bacterium]|nr:DUF192 domain-containing protein [Melioribacteraceae bacterium]
MSKKNNQKDGNKKSLRTRKQKIFQIAAGFVFVIIILFFVFSTFLRETANSNGNNIVKDYTAFIFKKQGELTFVSSDGKFYSKIDIEIADNDDSRSQGLMYRNKMTDTQGMFFIFPNESYQSFWMKNTVIPLDIIFVNKKNEIVKIHKNAVPFDESSYASGAPAIYVVEVNAGYTDRYKIKVGDKIVWRRM